MATQVGEAIIKLTFDDKSASSEIKNTESKLNNFGSKVGNIAKNIAKTFTVAFAGMTTAAIAFTKKSVDAFNEAEKAQAKLAQSAKNQNWTDEAVKGLRSYNSELQKLGIIEDDIYAAGQAQLGTFGLSAEAVKTLTPAMGDLIAATSGYEASTDSATQMANLMGKVMTGNVGALTRYGVTLDENQKKLLQNGNEMQKASVLAEVLQQNYGDFNKALSETPQGRVKQLSNEFGDLQESFGAFIAGKGDLNEFFNNLDTVVDTAINLITDMAPQVVEGITKLINKINEKLPEIIEKLLPIATDIIVGIATALIDNAPILIDSMVTIATEIVKAIIKNLPKIMDSIGKALPKAIGPLLAIIGGSLVFGKIKKLLGSLFTGNLKNTVVNGAKSLVTGVGEALSTGFQVVGNVLNSAVQALVGPLKTLLQGVAEALAGFFKAFADPMIAVGAAMFAVAAASIAAAIYLIGTAIGAVMPALTELFNNIIMPIAQFIADTVLTLIDALTTAVVTLTQNALIPLGEFLVGSFIAIITAVADVITNLTNNALVPLINTLSGAFTEVLNAIANLLTGVISAALQGVAEIVRAVGEGFEHMGNAIKTALEGVQGVLQVFADLIKSIAEAAVAIVALVTGHSINYGGGYAHLFAEGGKVEGPGTGTSDSIPAMLSNGEYVIKASSARAIGYDTLDMLNEGKKFWADSLTNDVYTGFDGTTDSGRIINVYMTNKIDNVLDADEIGQVMMESIRRAA